MHLLFVLKLICTLLWSSSFFAQAMKLERLGYDKETPESKAALAFGIDQLNKVTTSPYKEKLHKLLEFLIDPRNPNQDEGSVYKFNVKLMETNFKKNNPALAPEPSESERIRLGDGRPFLVPYTAPLKVPIKDGTELTIEASIPSASQKFIINIHSGEDLSKTNDIQLQIYVPLGLSGLGARLNRVHYDSIEVVKSIKTVFLPGDDIKLKIVFYSRKFEIYNRDDYLGTVYDTSSRDPTHLTILGMLDVKKITEIRPEPQKLCLSPTPTTPHIEQIKVQPFKTGSKIRIDAFIPKAANRFDITLQDDATRHAPKRPFHFSYEGMLNHIALNHYDSSTDELMLGWGSQVRSQIPPYVAPGNNLEIEIECTEEGYKVTFFGIESWNMVLLHRLSSSFAKYLNIDGDIYIKRITYTESPSTPLPREEGRIRECWFTVWDIPMKNEKWLKDWECDEQKKQ